MTIKTKYELGDTVWVYGISRNRNRLTKGTIIHSFSLEHAGYNDEPHYIIAIPNEIEALLEVRTWHNISQDDRGPVGTFRKEIPKEDVDSVDKKLSQLGLTIEEFDRFEEQLAEEDNEISADDIHAALEKSKTDVVHPPMFNKEARPKRKYFSKRKKTNAS